MKIEMEVIQTLSSDLENNNHENSQESCQKKYNVAEEGYKCGEAYYVSSIGAINIRCTLCGAYFEYVDEGFLKHVVNEHFSSLLIVKASHEFHLSIKAENLLNTEVEDKNGALDNIGQNDNNISDIRKSLKNSEKVNQKSKQEKRLKKFKCTLKKDSHKLHLSMKAENLLDTEIENKNESLKHIGQHNKNVVNIRKSPINSEKVYQKLKQKKHFKKFKKDSSSEKLIPEKYKCLTCSKEFEKKSDLVTHQKLHVNNLKANDGLICEQCGKKFAQKNGLDYHNENAHNPNRKLFPCNECDKLFTTSESLMAHNRHYHTKELLFVCEVENCTKKYASKNSLKNHQIKHSNTIFSCTECNKQYSHKKILQTHYKRHHSIMGKTYHCGQCDKSFYGSYFLKKHMVCHTNERPFLCDQCPANFPREKALVAHKKIHSGMRNEVCKLCGQAFNLYEGLYQHMKIKHKIKYHKGMTIEDMKNKEKEFMETNIQFLNR